MCVCMCVCVHVCVCMVYEEISMHGLYSCVSDCEHLSLILRVFHDISDSAEECAAAE